MYTKLERFPFYNSLKSEVYKELLYNVLPGGMEVNAIDHVYVRHYF